MCSVITHDWTPWLWWQWVKWAKLYTTRNSSIYLLWCGRALLIKHLKHLSGLNDNLSAFTWIKLYLPTRHNKHESVGFGGRFQNWMNRDDVKWYVVVHFVIWANVVQRWDRTNGSVYDLSSESYWTIRASNWKIYWPERKITGPEIIKYFPSNCTFYY